MISITVHDPTTVGHELCHGPHAPYVSMVVGTDTDGAVGLAYRTPDALRELAREASRAASELSAAIAAQDRVSA